MIPIYPALACGAVAAVVALELAWLRTGILRQPAYWISMAIVLGFQVLVDGWMSKRSDPITIYNPKVLSGVRFPFDIPLEEFAYGFALITLAMVLWDHAGRAGREVGRQGPPGTIEP